MFSTELLDEFGLPSEPLGGRLVQIRDEWLAAAQSCVRVDRVAAEQAVQSAYRAGRLDRPQIIWLESLAALRQAIVVLESYDAGRRPELSDAQSQGGAVIRRAFHGGWLHPMPDRPGLVDLLWADPTRFVGDWPVSARLRNRVDAVLGTVSRSASRLSDTAQLGRVGAQLWRDASLPVRPGLALGALGDATAALLWQCYLEFGATDQPVIAASLEVLRQVGWFVPMAGLVLLVERPARLLLDSRGELSNLSGPAVQWWDGDSGSYQEGVPVPPELWDKTLTEILAEPNLERRRIYLKLRGWGDGIGDIVPLGEAADPGNPGQLVKLFELRGSERPRRFIEVANASLDLDGTRRQFIIEVSPDATDPIAAVAATFGLDAASYRQLQRAC